MQPSTLTRGLRPPMILRFLKSVYLGFRAFPRRQASSMALLLASLWLVACFSPDSSTTTLGKTKQATIYGTDDRVDAVHHPDEKLRQLSDSVALIFSSSYLLDGPSEGIYTFETKSLAERVKANTDYGGKGVYPLCSGEPLGDEPAIPGCTGFLIGPKLMATAGHCPGDGSNPTAQELQSWCNGRRIVFGWQKASDDALPTEIKEEQIFYCKRILRFRLDQSPAGIDYSVFELDREPGLPILEIDTKTTIDVSHPVAIIGHPHGLPKKIALGGIVTKPRSSTLDYFETSLDTMPGNSGSPVFSMQSYKIIGIHVRGKTSYELDDAQQCMKNTRYFDIEGSQDETYIRHIAEVSCQQESDCPEDFMTCESGVCTVRFPDLKVEDFQLSATEVLADQEVTATFKVTNAGTSDIDGRFRISLWWSSNAGIVPSAGQDVRLESDFIDALKVGESKALTMRFRLSAAVLQEKQYVGVYVDDLRRYSDGREADSTIGIHTEITSDNNSDSIQVLSKQCSAPCPQVGQKRCGSTQGDVEECKLQSDGCPAWIKVDTCPSGSTCQPDGSCKQGCPSSPCTLGEKRCTGEVAEQCGTDNASCLVWQKTSDCSTQSSYCDQGACQVLQKEGSGCTSDRQCETSSCKASSSSTSDKRCARPCQAEKDCTNTSFPSCQGGVCVAAPQPECSKDEDCPRVSSPNMRAVCNAGQCKRRNNPCDRMRL